MSSNMKYFIGNWKMFGIPGSFKIIKRINEYYQKDKKNNKKYKVIIAPPTTLLQDFSKKCQSKKIIISAQNCFNKDKYGAHTGQISPFMINKIGVNHIILGHSESRIAGETDQIIRDKVSLSIKNNFNIIFCIGENAKDKKNKKTFQVLKRQILRVLKKNYNYNKIIIAYEPVWAIGSGKVPKNDDLKRISIFLKKFIKLNLKTNNPPKLIYGGSVDKKLIKDYKFINELDGFLIGGASKSSKNFIDIIKNFYK